MERKRISDKVKIIAVVTAVLIVASALAVGIALTNKTDTTSAMATSQNAPAMQNGDIAARSVAAEKTQLGDPVLEFNGAVSLEGTTHTATYDTEGDSYTGYAIISGIIIGENTDAVEYIVEGTEIDSGLPIQSGIGYDAEDFSFSVKNAGNYTIKMRIVDTESYEWANASDVDANGCKTIGSLTIKQAILDVEWSNENGSWDNALTAINIRYHHYLDVNKLKENFEYIPHFAYGDSLAVVAKFYSNSGCTAEINGEFPLGDVYVKIVEIVAGASGDRSFANYRLPKGTAEKETNLLRRRINIQTGYVAKPILSRADLPSDFNVKVDNTNLTITAPYKGVNNGYYTVTQFIDDIAWDNKYDSENGQAYDSGKNLIIKIDGQVVNWGEIDSYFMSNVKINPQTKAVEPYLISFEPAENFGWDRTNNPSRAPVVYKLTVQPAEILGPYTHANWTTEYTYTGEEISLDNCYSLKYGADAVFEGDSFEFVIDKTQYAMAIEGTDEQGKPVITGYTPILRAYNDYRILITGIVGESAHNYVLPAASGEHYPNGVGFDVAIHVNKKPILTDGVETGITADYNGLDSVSVSIKDLLIEYEMAVNLEGGLSLIAECIAIECKYPNNSVDSANHGATVTRTVDDVFFNYSRAGSYKLTFQINATTSIGANYTFPNGEDQYAWEDFAVINPLVIDPISMDAEYRSIMKDDDYKDISSHINALLSRALGTNSSLISIEGFGDRNNSSRFSATQANIDCVNGKHVEGEYYVLIKIADGAYPHSCYFKESVEHEFEVLDDGTAKIYYVVSSNVINFVHSVTNYSFGDNKTVSDVIRRVSATIDESKIGETTFKFYYDEEMTNEVAASDLTVNGIPRNVGTYYIQATVIINDTEIESPWTNSKAYELTVNPRALSLEWSVDNSTVDGTTHSLQYNGQPHSVQASIASGSLVAGANNVTLSVANATGITNADTYSWNVSDLTLSGADSANYTLDGATNTTFTLTVTRREITITASNISLVYGQTLTEQTLNSNASITGGSFINNEHQNGAKITVYIYNNGNRFTDLSNPPRGTSMIVPVWIEDGEFVLPALSDGAYIKTLDNYVITMQTATLSVEAQELKIRFTGNVGTSVYGDEPAFGSANIVEYVSGLVVGDNLNEVLSFVAKKGNEVLSSTSSAGKYTVTVELADEYKESYRLTVEGAETGQNKYEVTPRDITVRFNEVEHIYRTQAQLAYAQIHYEIEGVLINQNDIKVLSDFYGSMGGKIGNIASDTIVVGGEYYVSASIDNNLNHPANEAIVKPFTVKSVSGNYSVTVIPGRLFIVPRPFDIAFTGNGSATYGEAPEDMFLRKTGSSNEAQYKLFNLVSPGSTLPILSGNKLLFPIRDMVAFKLVDKDETEYEFTANLPAGTYTIKPVAGSANFTVGEVTGTEQFGKIIISPRKITAEVSSTVTSVVYGNAWTGQLNYTVTSGSVSDGDDLGITVSIFNQSDEQVNNISKQNVGDYYVGLSWTNSNYEIEYQKVTISVTSRQVTVTPNNAASTYGNTFDVSSITWHTTTSNGEGDAVLNGDNLYISANVYDGVTKVTNFTTLTVKDGGYKIVLSKGDNANANYTVTLNDGVFTVNQRAITITAQDVTHAYGSGWKNGDKYNELKYQITSELKIVDGDNLNITLAVYEGENDVTNDVANLSTDGVYTVKVTASNANYAITVVNATFSVNKLKAMVEFKDGASSVYGEAVSLQDLLANNVICEITGLLDEDMDAVIISIVNRNNPSISVTDAKAPVGEYLVTVSISSNYEVEYVNWEEDNKGLYTVTERKITVTPNAASVVYGNALASNLTWTANVSNGSGDAVLTGDNLGITLDVYNGTQKITSSIASQIVGNYTIKIDASAANANYTVTVNTAAFTITQATITLTAKPVSVIYGNELSLASDWYTASSSNTTQATVNAHLASNAVTNETNYTTLTAANASGITVTPVCSSNANVAVTVVSAAVTVNKRAITLTFTTNGGTSVYGNAVDLYSNSVGALASGDLVNGHVYKNVVSLSATKGGVAMASPANVGEYVVTATLNSGYSNNYLLTVNGSGKYVVTEASITVQSVANFNGQYDGNTHESAINVTTVNSQAHAISYITRSSQITGEISALDWTKSTSTLTTTPNVSTTYVYYRVTANNHATVYGYYSIQITKRQVELGLSLNISGISYKDSLPANWYGYKVAGTQGFVGSEENAFNFVAHVYDGASDVTNSVSSLPVKDYTVKLDYTSNENYQITVNTVTLTVSKRIINVTFGSSGTSVYGNAVNLYGDNVVLGGLLDGATIEDYKAVLVLTAKNADGITASNTSPAGDYTVTASLADTQNYGINYANGSNSGGYQITARPITITFTNSGASSVYGEAFNLNSADVFSYACDFVNGHGVNDIITVSATDASNAAMEQTNPHAGVYTVKTTLKNSNYQIVYGNGNTGVYTITKRVITVTNTTPAMEFMPLEGDDYVTANGAYGKAHNVTLEFDNAIGSINASEYSVVYNTVQSDNQTANEAPITAGVYVVTVALNASGNYTFGYNASDEENNEANLDFEVTKIKYLSTDFFWQTKVVTIEHDGAASVTNVVESFDSAIMTVSIGRKPGNDQVVSVTPTYNESRQLSIEVDGSDSVYSAVIAIRDEAKVNYEITDSEAVIAEFTLTNSTISTSVVQQNWQYTDALQRPAFAVFIDGTQYAISEESNITYLYGVVSKDKYDQAKALIDSKGDGFTGFDISDAYISELYSGLVSESEVTFDVGYYIVCVTYSGTVENNGEAEMVAVRGCDVFAVEKKQLESPAIAKSTFDGTNQTPTITYGTANGVDVSTLVTTSNISSKNAGDFDVEFTITNSNYVWKTTKTDKTTVVWTIDSDNANNDGNKYFTVGTIANATYGDANITLPNHSVKVTGYDEVFVWYYASKAGTTSVLDITNWTEWTAASQPQNAGEYWVVLVMKDSHGGNFSPKYTALTLQINKATLTITPTGTLTYGQKFADGEYSYEFNVSGFKYEDNKNNVTFGGTVTYSLVDNTLDTAKLAVKEGGYALKANSTLTADNYVITTQNGILTVNARKVTVTISNVTNRQYGWAIDLSSVTATSDDEFATAEVVDNIIKSEYLTTTAEVNSPVGDYVIESSYKNANFEITPVNGKYQIIARNIYVTLNGDNAGGTYKGTIGEVTIATITDDDGTDISALVNAAKYLTITYGGTAFDGTSYNGANTHAGRFNATVTGDVNNANFKIVSADTVNFDVNKIVVDASKISVESQMYTGGELKPNVKDKHYNINGEIIYNVVYNLADLKDAGDHNITLSLTDENNYAWNSLDNASKTVTVVFEIAGAGIYAIPYGSVVYGTPANGNLYYRLVYASGVNKGKDASADVDVTGEVVFKFVDTTLETKLNKLDVGSYDITLKTENGFVVGLKSNNPNYKNIALELDENDQIVYGKFTVTVRPITIKPVSSTSVYSQAAIFSNQFTLEEGTWAPDDDASVIDYVAQCSAVAGSTVGNYPITAQKAENDNYAITVLPGQHVITPIVVYVEVVADGGTYNGSNQVAQVRFTELRGNVDLGAFTEEMFVYAITGTENNGNSYTSSNKTLPANAGTYYVTLSGISDGNYALDETAIKTCTFVISKKVIDQDVINAREGAVYNGEEQSHGISAVENEYSVIDNDVYKDAKPYTVTLRLENQYNYTWKDTTDVEVYKQFVIGKAVLTLKPSGSLVYGQAFDGNNNSLFSYELTGFKGTTDDETVVDKVSNVVYMLVNSGERLVVNTTGYALTVELDNNGHVKGLSAPNYNIEVETGTLMITKRDITIKPVTSTSIYGQPIVLSKDFDVVGDGFVFGDDKTVILDYTPSTTATSQSRFGEYTVTADARANNYKVNVEEGKHIIEQVKVGVVIRPIDGVYGDESKGGVAYVRTVATNLNDEPLNGLTFILKYSGKANNGVDVISTSLPRLAGLYEVKVDGVINSNYVIDYSYGISSTMIEIARRAIDVRDIVAQSVKYTGSAIKPQITDSIGEDNVYTVNYGAGHANGFMAVGKYPLTVTLTDTNNYCWLNNLNPYDTITFEITKADNAIVDANGNVTSNAKVQIENWTIDGEVSKPQVRLLNGLAKDVVFEYSTNEYGYYTAEVPVNAGTYWVRATMAASDNYNAFVSDAVSFVINKRVINMPTVKNSDAKSVYSGEMQSLEIDNFDDKVMSLNCDLFSKNSNGVLILSALNAGKYTATLSLRNSDNYEWENNSQLVNGNVVIEWTIERKVLSKLPDAANKILVNGEEIVFIPDGFNSGIMTIESNVESQKGKYNAIVSLKDTVNYAWEGTNSDSISVKFELTGTNVAFIASICVVAGLSVGLAVMAVILTLVNRRKKRKQEEERNARSRADGWTE